MDPLQSLLCCFPGAEPTPLHPAEKQPLITAQPSRSEKQALVTTQPSPCSNDDAAIQFLLTLRTATTGGPELHAKLDEIVSTTGWTSSLAEGILHGVAKTLDEGAKMNAAMTEAVARATSLAEEFAREHPVWAALIASTTVVIALGVLADMAPVWVLRALGFVVKGPRGGELSLPVDIAQVVLS